MQPDQYLRRVDQAGALSLRGPKKDLQASAKREFDGMDGWDGWMDGMDGWDGVSKVSFNFLYTLYVYRSSIYLLLYIKKFCHQHPYGFENLMSSWGVGIRFPNLPLLHQFLKIIPKVRFFKTTVGQWPFWHL